MRSHSESKIKIKKIEELESLRGLAALLIVFGHFPKWSPLLNIGILNNAYLMVDLFFVLSGFVIYSAYVNRIKNVRNLLHFQFLRFGRLYPVHLFFLIAFILIESLKYFAQNNFGIISPNTQPFRENSLTALIQQFFLIQAIGPTQNTTSFNSPAWSISVEFYTYLIFGLILLLKRDWLYFLLISILSLTLLVSQETFGFSCLINCFAGFFIGCLTSILVVNSKVRVPKYFSLLIFIFIVFFLQVKNNPRLDILIYFLSAALIFSLVLTKTGYLNKILNIRLLSWLGLISYSLYMSHYLIIWISNQIFRIFFKKTEALSINGISTPALTNLETFVACFVLIIAIIFISAYIYIYIEKPFRDKSRRFVFSRRNNFSSVSMN